MSLLIFLKLNKWFANKSRWYFTFTKQFNEELTPRRNWRNRLILKHNQLLKTKEIGLGLATSIEATLKEYIERFGQRTHFQPALSIHQMPLFNTLSGYGSYIFPAVASLIIHQTIVLGLAMLVASYREQHEKITPIRFAGIFASIFTIGCLGSFYLLVLPCGSMTIHTVETLSVC